MPNNRVSDITDSDNESVQSTTAVSSSNSNGLKRKSPASSTESDGRPKKMGKSHQIRTAEESLSQSNNSSSEDNEETASPIHRESDKESPTTDHARQTAIRNNREKEQTRVPFRAPDGFEVSTTKHRHSAHFDVKGKKLWHIIAPRSISLSAITEIDIAHKSQINIKNPGEGICYGLKAIVATELSTQVLLVPSDSGQCYRSIVSTFDDTFHMQRLMPTSEQIIESHRLSVESITRNPSSRAARRQQEGLKPRHWATGFDETRVSIEMMQGSQGLPLSTVESNNSEKPSDMPKQHHSQTAEELNSTSGQRKQTQNFRAHSPSPVPSLSSSSSDESDESDSNLNSDNNYPKSEG